jgi:hypothetical protein
VPGGTGSPKHDLIENASTGWRRDGIMLSGSANGVTQKIIVSLYLYTGPREADRNPGKIYPDQHLEVSSAHRSGSAAIFGNKFKLRSASRAPGKNKRRQSSEQTSPHGDI